jgi:hypothetical protein
MNKVHFTIPPAFGPIGLGIPPSLNVIKKEARCQGHEVHQVMNSPQILKNLRHRLPFLVDLVSLVVLAVFFFHWIGSLKGMCL